MIKAQSASDPINCRNFTALDTKPENLGKTFHLRSKPIHWKACYWQKLKASQDIPLEASWNRIAADPAQTMPLASAAWNGIERLRWKASRSNRGSLPKCTFQLWKVATVLSLTRSIALQPATQPLCKVHSAERLRQRQQKYLLSWAKNNGYIVG